MSKQAEARDKLLSHSKKLQQELEQLEARWIELEEMKEDLEE